MSDRQNEAETNGADTGIDTGSDGSRERTEPTRWRGSRRRFLGTTAGVGVGAALGVATAGTASAQADGATVYIGQSTVSSSGALHAVDAASGQKQWTFTGGGQVHSSPTVVNGTLYVGSGDSSATTLHAIDAATGQEEWAFTEPGQFMFSSPTVIGGTAYVGADDSVMYAVDAATGEKQWGFEAGGRVNPSPQVVNGSVYFGAGTSFDTGARDSTIYAVDAETGGEEWQFTEPTDSVLSSPVVGGGTLYAGSGRSRNSNDSTLYAVDVGTGTEEWRFTEPDTSILSSPILDGNTVYFGTGADLAEGSGNLYAVNAETGDQEWVFTDPSEPVMSSPTLYEGTIYVGHGAGQLGNPPDIGTMYAVDAETGSLEWEYDVGKPVFSSPTAYNGVVYVGAMDGNLYAFDAETGEEEWIFTETTDVVVNSPTIVADPENGDSVGTRVTLGTLGHNQAWPDDGDDDPPAAEASVGLDPESREVDPDEQGELDVRIEGAENGVAGYDMTIDVGDAGVAAIADVVPTQNPASAQIDIAADGSNATVSVDMGTNGYGPGDSVVADLTVEGDATGSTSVSLSNVTVTDTEDETYSLTAVGSATVTVSDDTSGDTVELSLQPADSDVGPGGQQTHDLLVEGAASGVGSYDATIAVGDTSLLTIDDARAFQTSTGLFETTIADDGSSVQFAGLVDFDAASQLTLAEIDVAVADTTGETSLDLSVNDIADSDASSYTVESATGATVTVSEDAGPPALPGQDDPPQDLNGDGLYRDINGDGSFTIADVQVFFQNRDSDAVQNNPECFNFDETDPPAVSIGDVQALFQDFADQSASGNADEAATEEGGSAFSGW